MTTSPLLYIWGDDDLAAGRIVERWAAVLAAEGGAPLERWDLRGELSGVQSQLAALQERISTPVMFGGGTLAVVTNVGPLLRAAGGREMILAAVGLLAGGNALAILDVGRSGLKGPPQKRLADVIAAAKGTIREVQSPKSGGLANWIDREARDRGLTLAPDAAKALADRVGGAEGHNDADRAFQTRTASMELDKLELYRGSEPIRGEDVRALVPEAVPSTVWGFVDAVAERKTDQALGLLDRMYPGTAEPVLVVVLYRRLRDLLELLDRLAPGVKLAVAAKPLGITSDYRAGILAAQARAWTTAELTDALSGILELDAMVKGAPGTSADAAQRRLAFTLWVVDHVGGRERQSA
jgi:DNA polymerase III delta subunit